MVFPKKYRMLFVNPPARVNKDIPNLGIAYAATYFKTKVVDLNTMPEPRNRFLKYKTDVLGISVQSRTFSVSKKIAEIYKKKYPNAKVKSIKGFLDVQCCYPYVDFEQTIEYKEPFSDKYLFPNYELFDSFELFQKNWEKGRWGYGIMTALGCPFQCNYCQSSNRKWRARSPENCYEELKQAKEKWNIKKFHILDDCFNVNKQRVLEFCRLVKKLNLTWSCSNGLRADIFDEDIARALYESGCKYINFGIESSSPKVLKAINKGETIEQIEKAIATAKKYSDGVSGFFILALPGSSYETDKKTIEWVKKQKINANFSYYVPFDKEMQFDKIFYGDNAQPVADTYSKSKQKELYEKSISLRSWQNKRIVLRKVKRKLIKILTK